MTKTIVIDIETENTGYDIMGDNKCILSVQTYDGNESVIYYDGSDTNDLSSAKRFLEEEIGMDTKFVGFNVRNFDVRFIGEFMDVESDWIHHAWLRSGVEQAGEISPGLLVL